MSTVADLSDTEKYHLITDAGATPGLLKDLRGLLEPPDILAAFKAMSVEQVAARIGYDLAADPDYVPPAPARAAAPPAATAPPARPAAQTRPAVPAQAARSARPALSRRPARRGYRAVTYGVSLVFGLFLAGVAWRLDGYFGVAFLRAIPGLSALPNTLFWPPVWTWLFGIGISALQAAFWPHRAILNDQGQVIEPASSLQELVTWTCILAWNITTSALGMLGIVAGLNLAGIVIPDAGPWLVGMVWFLAVVFALYPEWALREFGGKLWYLLVPQSVQRSITVLQASLRRAWATLDAVLPRDPRFRIGIAGVAGVTMLGIITLWVFGGGDSSPAGLTARP